MATISFPSDKVFKAAVAASGKLEEDKSITIEYCEQRVLLSNIMRISSGPGSGMVNLELHEFGCIRKYL